jgi:hypothetical protein
MVHSPAYALSAIPLVSVEAHLQFKSMFAETYALSDRAISRDRADILPIG